MTIAPAASPRILYVDDDDSLLFLARRLLRRAGFDVVTSRTPDEALAELRRGTGRFDLVVTDCNMPVMSGIDMARELRAMGIDVPIVLVSGHITPQLRADAMAAGVSQVVYKQSSVEQICTALEAIARQATGSEAAPSVP